MSIVKTEILIDSALIEKADNVFKNLGIDITTAIEIFLNRCVAEQRFPLTYNEETMKVLEECRRNSGDDSIPGYNNVEDLIKALKS